MLASWSVLHSKCKNQPRQASHFFELDPAFVDIIDAAPLLEVLERVVGPDVECTGVQARSVPPAPHAGQAYTR